MSLARFVSVFVLGAAVLGGPVGALAQTPPAPSPDAVASPDAQPHRWHHESLLHALRALNLTPAQQSQVDGFRAERDTANRNADPLTRQANARKMRGEIMAILTPAQKAQLKTVMHSARRYPMGAASGAPDAAPTSAPN
jgi:Spy/CpxP family protein refolding chaperone